MAFRKHISLAVLGLSMALPLAAAGPAAQGNTLDQVIRKIQQQQKQTTSLQADFKQEKVLALLAKPDVSTGQFAFAKPNQVRWSYAAPKRVEMLITGGVMTTYFPDLNKAERLEVKRFEDRIFKYMGATGAIDELGRYFDFTFSDKASSPFYLLDLTPKTKVIARRAQRIKIWIDKKTYIPSKFEYVEGDGDITRYEFTNIRLNEQIPPGKFALNLPANVKLETMKLQ
jgi:outer membrane lipoprotein-sorting protein